jgi:hypothetical protein
MNNFLRQFGTFKKNVNGLNEYVDYLGTHYTQDPKTGMWKNNGRSLNEQMFLQEAMNAFSFSDDASGGGSISKKYFLGPKLYGSKTVSNWLKDVYNGLDSIDLLVIGDSNTGYGGQEANGGYVQGLGYALNANIPNKMYSTALFQSLTTGTIAGYRAQNFPGNALPNYGYSAGVEFGPSELTTNFNSYRNAAEFEDGTDGIFSDTGGGAGGTLNYSFLKAGATQTNTNVGLYVNGDSPLGPGNTLTYRVLRGSIPNTGGTYNVRIRRSTSPFTVIKTQTNISVRGSEYNWVTDSITITGDSSRSGLTLDFLWSIQSAVGILNVGPIAIAGQSVHANKKGWSVDALYYYGGSTIERFLYGFNMAGKETVATLLKEYRDKQIEAGGSGRVAILIQGGINESDWTGSNQTEWLSYWQNIITICKNAWATINAPSSDLQFCVMFSHNDQPGLSTDSDFTERRNLLISLFKNNPEVCVIHLPSIVTFGVGNFANGGSYYDDNVHLTKSGFQFISDEIIKTMLNA